MQRINDDEGDAFPFEQARIIAGGVASIRGVSRPSQAFMHAEIELTMPDEELRTEAYFPKWLHVLKPKVALLC